MPQSGIAASVRHAASAAAGALSRQGVSGSSSDEGVRQTLTIAAPASDVAAAWRDAATLTDVLGDLGSVEAEGDARYRWRLDDTSWATRLVEEGDLLRHVEADAADDGGRSLTLSLSPAPSDLGTEATLTMHAPLPALAAGGVAFTMLYRLRALLITGEAPTTSGQPSGRSGDH